MKKIFIVLTALCFAFTGVAEAAKKKAPKADLFPDGTIVPEWFRECESVKLEDLGKQYKVTDYGVMNDGKIYTRELQALIDRVAADGGGVIVIPEGTFLSGALFFRQGTHLHIKQGGTLMGSDDISDFPLMKTRIEGETCTYYPALVNADGLDGFTISGQGSIDGNGLRYWKAFWLRRKWNPKCTNKDEQRPRLVYISNSKNVTISDVHLQNSPFWTTHIYNSSFVKLLNLYIFSPEKPVKAPSTDAIDIDVCHDVLVKGCYMSVNDDAIALKGGKGPWADDPQKSEGNGKNYNIIIEDCVYGFCHGCLTCGSESVYNHNIVLRRIKVTDANNLLWLKMRPDTPQRYEYITVEDITGNGKNFLLVKPWTQFYDLKDRKDPPMSYSDHIVMRNITFDCDYFFNVKPQDDQYKLSNFTFQNLNIRAKNTKCDRSVIDGFVYENVNVSELK